MRIALLAWLCAALPAAAQDTAYYEEDPVAATVPASDEGKDGQPAGMGTANNTADTVVQNTAAPTTAQWQKLTGDEAFGYRNTVEYVAVEKPEKPPEIPWFLRMLDAIFTWFGSTAGTIFLWCIVGLIVGYIIYRIVAGEGNGLFSRRRKIDNSSEGVVESEDLYGANWEKLMQDALARGDARAAIRCSYMLTLQALQEQNLISFRQDKTNAAYARELFNSPFRDAFKSLSRQFEYAWYGNFIPPKPALDAHFSLFKETQARIKN